ncbi:MAG: COG1361 S-layer family protein [Candidatus Nanohaloarchaea archaeon]
MKHKLTAFLTAFIALTAFATAAHPANEFKVFSQTDPFPVQAGEEAEIFIELKHMGDQEFENVTVELVGSYPFQIKPDQKTRFELGTIHPADRFQLSPEVLVAENAPEGEAKFLYRIGKGDDFRQEHLTIDIANQKVDLSVANLRTSPSSLMPGSEENRLTVEIVNNGDETAENVIVRMEPPEGFTSQSSFATRQSLGNLAPGQVKPVSFSFDISENVSAGMKTFRVTANHSDTEGEISEDFQLKVDGKPQFSVVNVTADLQTGSEGVIRMKIRNTGSERSESTRVRVLENSDLPFSFSSAARFIGTLKPGATGTVVFNPSVEPGASVKEYLMDFEITGNRDGEVFVEQKVVDLRVRQGGNAGGPPLIPAAGVLVGLVALLYIFRGRIPL